MRQSKERGKKNADVDIKKKNTKCQNVDKGRGGGGADNGDKDIFY